MHEVQARPATGVVAVDDAWLADALAAKRTTPAWSPSMPFGGLTPPALRLPNMYALPSLTVTTPTEATQFLADLTALRDRDDDEINAQYTRSRNEPGAFERKQVAYARVAQRYRIDVQAIENRSALNGAQAAEDAYRAFTDEVEALYPDE